MSNRESDGGDRLPGGPEGLGRWRAELKERITYLVLDLGVGMGLVGYQGSHAWRERHPPPRERRGAPGRRGSAVEVEHLPHRLLTIVVYACLVAVVVSGLFTGIGVLWAVVNGVVFFLGAGMYESTRVTIEERPDA